MVLVSSTGPSVNPSVNAQTLPSQHSQLAFTVEPDRSVRVGANTTVSLPSSVLMNVSNVFPPGYSIHSSSSFSQQSDKVVQTTTAQYVLPQAVIQASQGLLNYVNLINLTSTQTGTSGQGTLRIDTTPSIVLPVSNVLVSYTDDPSHVDITASAQVHFYSGLTGNLSFLSSQSAFQSFWTATFLNTTWTNMIISQIQNATKILRVTAFSGTINSIDANSASISIVFDAVPTTAPYDFVSAIEQSLAATIPAGLDSIIRQLIALSTSQTLSLTYAGPTNTVTVRLTTNYVADLDSKLNSIKTQFFQFFLGNLPALTPIPPAVSFINSTSIIVSQMSMTSDLDVNASTYKTSVQGLILKPPTVGPNTNFTIPGLFQTLGMVNQTGTELTLIGGSNSSYTIKILVPSGTPQPSSTTANSYTWTNQNATALQGVRFELAATSSSLFTLLTSPTALAVEAIAAVAVIAGVILLMRRKQAAVPPPTPVMGPAPTPGPSPAPPSPAPPNP